MKIDAIYTERDYKKSPSWDLVREWEDDLCKQLNISLIHSNRLIGFMNKVLRKFRFLIPLLKVFRIGNGKNMLYFEMDALCDNPLYNSCGMIPVIIDFFVKDEDIPVFLHRHSNNKAIMISSKQAYDKVVSFKPKIPVFHLPLTLSDRYCNNGDLVYQKKYALTLFGRQNKDSFFVDMIEKYASENPDFEYVYQDEKDMNLKSGYIYKTNKGRTVGQTNTRFEYMSLVQATKIAIYSTPGFGGRKDSNEYNQVTPKFLEYIASQCHVILRYPDNSDTRFFELSSFSICVKNYNDFKKVMNDYMERNPDYEFYKNYMDKHYTSKLVGMLNCVKL